MTAGAAKSAAALLTDRDGGVHLALRVSPGSSRQRIEGIHGGALKVAVRAAPERGKANDAVIALLSDALGLRESQVRVVSGATARDKVLRIDGIGREELARRLGTILDSLGSLPTTPRQGASTP